MNTPPTGSLTVQYSVTYSNNWQFSKIKEVETVAGGIEFVALDKPRLDYEPSGTPPLIDLYLIVGYVSETLDVVSTQSTVTATERFSDDFEGDVVLYAT